MGGATTRKLAPKIVKTAAKCESQVSWLAVVCGLPFWATIVVIAFHIDALLMMFVPSEHDNWIRLISVACGIGSVLGITGTIWSRGHYAVARIGLLINWIAAGLLVYVFCIYV